MAKVTTQSIPSEQRILYKRACQIATTSRGADYVRSRYPWRMPAMQGVTGANVKPAQTTQRQKFLLGRDQFEALSSAQKTAWLNAATAIDPALFTYNFKQQNFLLDKIANKEIELGENTSYAKALTQDSNYVWIARDFWPAKLIRVTKADYTVSVEVTFPTENLGIKTVLQDATYIWCFFNCAPAKLCRVPRADPENYDTYTFAAGENYGIAMVDDGTYLWCSVKNTDPEMVRVEKANPANRTTYTINEVSGYIIGLTQDATYLWATCGNNPPADPAYVIQIEKANANNRVDQIIDGTSLSAGRIVDDGTYLWIACAGGDVKYIAKLWRVTKADITQQTVYNIATKQDPAPGESSWIEDLIIDGDYIWCAPLLRYPALFKVLRSDPGDESQWWVRFAGDRIYRLGLDGDYIWGAYPFETATTATLHKIYKALSPYS